ncbi:MAG TPA: S41 family peptidase [Chitinophagaceae bacterium]
MKESLMRLSAFLTIIIVLFCGPALYAQSNKPATAICIQQATRLLDEAFVVMQKHYYKKDSVQWDELVNSAKSRLNNSTDCETAYETLEWCFKQIKEKHSFILPPVKAARYNGNVNSSTEPAPIDELIGPLKHELAEQDIAYIDVPWVSTADNKICTEFAENLQQLIADYDKKGINKWIIDLRNNTGGNCWPMLAGLGPLLGDGIHGYFVSSDEKIPFSYQQGNMMQGKYSRCTVNNPYTMSGSKRTIVVLTGPNTASAGEIVALAFKGKDNVYLFGQPTAGLTTANATYKLSDGSVLVLTVCKEADRNGNIYEGKIQPDKMISPAINAGKDAVKSSALMFLQME